MEELVKSLIKKLQHRKNKEFARIAQYSDDRDIIMMSSGKILELDNFINDLEEMLKYYRNVIGDLK
jgi:hypothetical protein